MMCKHSSMMLQDSHLLCMFDIWLYDILMKILKGCCKKNNNRINKTKYALLGKIFFYLATTVSIRIISQLLRTQQVELWGTLYPHIKLRMFCNSDIQNFCTTRFHFQRHPTCRPYLSNSPPLSPSPSIPPSPKIIIIQDTGKLRLVLSNPYEQVLAKKKIVDA